MFKVGQEFNRKELQDLYGGQRQSGIATSRLHPIIFLFDSGKENIFDYRNEWVNSDIYHYSGEGQSGDMVFTRGNKALRDHKKNNKRVFLFEFVSKGTYRFKSELEVENYEELKAPKTKRNLIVFTLKRIAAN